MTGGASASDEFIELYNPSSAALPLEGLEVVYVTASGATVTRKAAWAAGAPVVEPGAHVLIANGAGIFAGLADVAYANGLAATGGSVALLTDSYLKAIVFFWLIGTLVTSESRLRTFAWTLALCSMPLAAMAVQHYLAGDFLFTGVASVKRISGYYGLTGNMQALQRFRWEVIRIWRKWLGRRGDPKGMPWPRMLQLPGGSSPWRADR